MILCYLLFQVTRQLQKLSREQPGISQSSRASKLDTAKIKPEAAEIEPRMRQEQLRVRHRSSQDELGAAKPGRE